MSNKTFSSDVKRDSVKENNNTKNLCGLTEREIDIMVKSFFPAKKRNTSFLRNLFQKLR